MKFYIVLRQNDMLNKRHESEDEATREAERLCHKENGRFYVLEAISFVESAPTPVLWKKT